jgi:hypothetical protein
LHKNPPKKKGREKSRKNVFMLTRLRFVCRTSREIHIKTSLRILKEKLLGQHKNYLQESGEVEGEEGEKGRGELGMGWIWMGELLRNGSWKDDLSKLEIGERLR